MARDGRTRAGGVLRTVVRGLRTFAYSQPAPRAAAPRPRIGLALGGGFARGLAHLGVLKVLVENQISIDALAGVSAGSIVAAAFAGGCSLEDLIERSRKIRWSQFARWTFPRMGFASNERLEAMLQEMLPCTSFECLRIPLAVVATDLSSGEAVVFRQGDLMRAIRASSTFPGLFAPVEYEGRWLVDGAFAASVPVAALSPFNVDKVVAVHLNGPLRPRITNFFEVVGQAFQIAQARAESTWRPKCDVVITPDVGDFKWDAFECCDQLVEAGERAAHEALPALRALIKPAGEPLMKQ
jgi:NTE family protein